MTLDLIRDLNADLEALKLQIKSIDYQRILILAKLNDLAESIREDYAGMINQQQLRDLEIKELKEKLNA